MNANKLTSREPLILLVEDRRATRLMIRKILYSDNYRVIEAENGEEALEIFATLQPEVVLMDIIMPVMDGLTACAHLRNMPGGDLVPILMFTGLDDGTSVEKAFAAGASDFISKPINWEELRHRVRRLTYLRRIEDINRHQAYYDNLTNLPNRILFNDRLTIALTQAQKDSEMLAVLFINIKNFKLINDAFGYDKGDLVLQGIGQRLVNSVGEEVTVARLGGDDFALILTKIQQEKDVAKVAQQSLKAIQKSWHISGQEVNITAIIGIALYPNDGLDIDTLLKNAETAMYRNSHNHGSTMYHFYNNQMNTKAFERLTLENSLHRALEENQFKIFYQPQIDIKTGKIFGVEALLRWEHPTQGLIPPDKFIPISEDTGLIIPIGEWMLNNVCKQHRHWQRKEYAPLKVSINLSAIQFEQLNLIDTITDALHNNNIPPELLTVEITETIAMQNINHTINLLTQLKKMNITIAIDDFGTGYSSLSYLKKLPIDLLKIDRSFVRDITNDEDDATIVATIILLATSLKLDVIAEGVETVEQLYFLSKHNCQKVQGYYFSKPMPALQLEHTFLQKNLK